MVLDIRGGLKNTRINQDHYIVFGELLSNAIDSYLIRKYTHNQDTTPALSIQFIVSLHKSELIEEGKKDLTIECIDNGIGFDVEQITAFVTKDTSYKDDLNIDGVQKCLGTGRIQYFHYFDKIDIDSFFCKDYIWKNTTSSILSPQKTISEKDFCTINLEAPSDYKTSIKLSYLKPKICTALNVNNKIETEFSPENLKNYIVKTFLQRFVSLKSVLGEFTIKLTLRNHEKNIEIVITHKDIPEHTQKEQIEISSNDQSRVEKFDITYYKIPHQVEIKENIIALCAKSSIVKKITDKILHKKQEAVPIDGHYHIIFIESNYLDECVNDRRDDFIIHIDEKDLNQSLNFDDCKITLQDIYDGISALTRKWLSLEPWDKEKTIHTVTQKYGISEHMISNSGIRVHYGTSDEDIAKRVIKVYADKVIDTTSHMNNMKEKLLSMNPLDCHYRDEIQKLSWEYTSKISELNQMSLSQLVVRRAFILDVFQDALAKNLQIQKENKTQRIAHEAILHNMLFPQNTDNHNVSENDLWLLNEEYQFYDYIVSDKPLSHIKCGEGTPFFEPDIDAELATIYNKIVQDTNKRRPDIALFAHEGCVIIIELKAPGVDLSSASSSLYRYARMLIAKSNGRLKKAYGYLIGDTIDHNGMQGYTPFPRGKNKAYFRTDSLGDIPGELYSEVLCYDEFLNKAKKRLKRFREKLGLPEDF